MDGFHHGQVGFRLARKAGYLSGHQLLVGSVTFPSTLPHTHTHTHPCTYIFMWTFMRIMPMSLPKP